MGEHVQGQAGADRAVGRPGPAARMVTTEVARPRPSVLIEPVAPYVGSLGGNGTGHLAPAPMPHANEEPSGPGEATAVVAVSTLEGVAAPPDEAAPDQAVPPLDGPSPDAPLAREGPPEAVGTQRSGGEVRAEPTRPRVHRQKPARQPVEGPRAARVFVTHVEPWSVMKQSFLLSLALAVILLVATASVWYVLDSAGVIEAITRTASDVGGESAASLGSYLSFSKVMGVAMVLAGVETVLVTALATLFAFMYNLAVGIGGGLEITIAEED